MLVFPNCKINLGLQVTGKRADGYHNIKTIFYPLDLKDALEIISSNYPQASVVFSQTGIPIAGDENDNLCIKAYHLLKKDFPDLPPVKIHLHKSIPMGAGLGGGSADGAFTLQLLNDTFHLNLSNGQLIAYALQLGSDCPFFIINKPCFAEGRGELLEPIAVSLKGYRLVLVNPGIHVNTGWAFTQLAIANNQTKTIKACKTLQSIIVQPIANWKDELINDFEKPVFHQYPAIKAIKDGLYQQGALFASMSGSGSSVYAIFENENLPAFHFPESYLVRNIEL